MRVAETVSVGIRGIICVGLALSTAPWCALYVKFEKRQETAHQPLFMKFIRDGRYRGNAPIQAIHATYQYQVVFTICSLAH
jgi:hypothetical protein